MLSVWQHALQVVVSKLRQRKIDRFPLMASTFHVTIGKLAGAQECTSQVVQGGIVLTFGVSLEPRTLLIINAFNHIKQTTVLNRHDYSEGVECNNLRDEMSIIVRKCCYYFEIKILLSISF